MHLESSFGFYIWFATWDFGNSALFGSTHKPSINTSRTAEHDVSSFAVSLYYNSRYQMSRIIDWHNLRTSYTYRKATSSRNSFEWGAWTNTAIIVSYDGSSTVRFISDGVEVSVETVGFKISDRDDS